MGMEQQPATPRAKAEVDYIAVLRLHVAVECQLVCAEPKQVFQAEKAGRGGSAVPLTHATAAWVGRSRMRRSQSPR